MHFITRSFLGHTEENSWSQYWENEPEDRVVASQKGHLFALANIISDQDVSASELGHQLIDSINQLYFSLEGNSIPLNLQKSIEMITSASEYDLVDISLTVAIINHDQLFLATLNSGVVYLKRLDKLSKILTGTTGQVVLSSGKINDNDLIFICTNNYFQNAGIDKIKSYLSLSKIQEIEESVLTDLYTLPQQSSLASLLIGIYDDNPKNEDISTESSPLPELKPITPEPPQPSVYIAHHDSDGIKKRRRLNIIFSILVLVALGISVYFGARQNKQAKIEALYQTNKTEYQQKIDNAKTVKNINLEEAQSLAKNAKEIAKKMQDLGIHGDEVKSLLTDADKILSETGSADSYQPDDFHDTTLINSTNEYSQLILAKNDLYLLDPKNGRLDKLDISTKSTQKIIISDQIKNGQSLAENNGLLYVLVDKQIVAIQNNKITSTINLSDGIGGFNNGKITTWNGSLYLLGHTETSSSIWKITPQNTTFTKPEIWVKGDTEFPNNSSSIAINGQVWVITKNGEIHPYSRGVKGEFKSKIVSNLTDANNLVTSLDSNIIAFTQGDSQVYVYQKDGVSASSYNFGNKHILSLALDATTNRLFALCSDKIIYQIKL